MLGSGRQQRSQGEPNRNGRHLTRLVECARRLPPTAPVRGSAQRNWHRRGRAGNKRRNYFCWRAWMRYPELVKPRIVEFHGGEHLLLPLPAWRLPRRANPTEPLIPLHVAILRANFFSGRCARGHGCPARGDAAKYHLVSTLLSFILRIGASMYVQETCATPTDAGSRFTHTQIRAYRPMRGGSEGDTSSWSGEIVP
jgi:hypothetical protein